MYVKPKVEWWPKAQLPVVDLGGGICFVKRTDFNSSLNYENYDLTVSNGLHVSVSFFYIKISK